VNKLAEVKKVVFATEESTVHVLMSDKMEVDHLGNEMYPTESRVLLPGEFVEQSTVPPYLLNAVKSGTAPGLQLMTEKRAKEVSAQAAEIRAMADSSASVTVPSESQARKESVKLAADAVAEENS
jgi:hypothetical protein